MKKAILAFIFIACSNLLLAQDCNIYIDALQRKFSRNGQHFSIEERKQMVRNYFKDDKDLPTLEKMIDRYKANHLPYYQDIGQYSIIDSIFREIKITAQKMGIFVQRDICYGTLPNYINNVETKYKNGHYIVLFDESLFGFFFEFMDLGLLIIDSVHPKEVYIKKGNSEEKYILTTKYLRDKFNHLLEKYMSSEKTFIDDFDIESDFSDLSAILNFKSLYFLACHEYAHIIFQDTGDRNETISSLWERELNADLLGYKIYCESINNHSNVIKSFSYAIPMACISAIDILQINEYKNSEDSRVPSSYFENGKFNKYVTIYPDKVKVSKLLDSYFPVDTHPYPPGEIRRSLLNTFLTTNEEYVLKNMSATEKKYFTKPIYLSFVFRDWGKNFISKRNNKD